MNRVFKITAYGRGRSGRLKQIKKRIYASKKDFDTHCVHKLKVHKVLSGGIRLVEKSTYQRYCELYVAVKLWELIDGEWVDITSKYKHRYGK